MPIKVACSCGKRLSIKTAYAGLTVKCPACQSRLRVPLTQDEFDTVTVPYESDVGVPGDMPIELVCSDCSKKYRLKDAAAGKSLTCRQCGKVLTVLQVVTTELTSASPWAFLPSVNQGLDLEAVLASNAQTPPKDLSPEAALEWIASNPDRSNQAVAPSLPASPGKSFGQFILRLCPVLVLLLLFTMQMVFAPLWESVRSESWPHVDGVITSSRLQRSTGGRGSRTRVLVSYDYEVHSMGHTGQRICVVGDNLSGSELLTAVLGRYPVGKSVKVYYDPGNASVAVLVPGVSSELFNNLVCAVFILGLFGWQAHQAFLCPQDK